MRAHHCRASLLTLLFATSLLRADFPVAIELSERQPPTNEDWFRYFLKRSERNAQATMGTCPTGCVGPIQLWREILYYPCRECPETSCIEHRSWRGCYGIRHPMPYYIPNPTIAVEIDDCERCAQTRPSWRFPNNRVEIVVGIWE